MGSFLLLEHDDLPWRQPGDYGQSAAASAVAARQVLIEDSGQTGAAPVAWSVVHDWRRTPADIAGGACGQEGFGKEWLGHFAPLLVVIGCGW
ncbi:hypothetical protein ACE0DR_10335 [Azotobacter sp. CWF10]